MSSEVTTRQTLWQSHARHEEIMGVRWTLGSRSDEGGENGN